MGSMVTVIDVAGRIAGQEDADVAGALQQLLVGEEIAFRRNARIAVIARNGAVSVTRLGVREAHGSHRFLATGRRPNTDDLGLETVGVAMSDRGIVQMDTPFATSVPGISVAGEICGEPIVTHASWDHHRILLSQITGDRTRTTERIVP